MKSIHILCVLLLLAFFVIGCQESEELGKIEDKLKIGMMLADYGLGDQSFNDTAFQGLTKAREELDIIFDYRDLNMSTTYEQGLKELITIEKSDLVIGLGHNMVESFKKVATEYPEQSFLFVDQNIDLPNVTSVTFKEGEGSFLVGIIAGLKTSTNTIGFVGGMDIPIINRFRDGFILGVKAVNPTSKVIVDYTGDFGKPEVGKAITKNMIEDHNIDIIYHAAGFSGLGAIEEAAENQIYAIGVDSDQFFVAEKTVITSMLKNVDVAVFQAVKEFAENGVINDSTIQLGIKENGVGVAPIRIITLSDKDTVVFESLKEELLNESISIQTSGTKK